MAKPTYQDADILMKMAQLGIELNLGELTGWLYSDQFIPDYAEFKQKYAPDSEEANKVRALLMWFETLGTLYKHDLFHGDLLFDWVFVGAPWERLKSYALAQRQESGNPRMYENFEALAIAEPK